MPSAHRHRLAGVALVTVASVALGTTALAGPARADSWSAPSSLDRDAVTTSTTATAELDVAGWSSERGSTPKAYAVVRSSGTWSSPMPLGGGGYQSRPVFAAAPDGAVTAVWTESRAGRREARVLSSTYADGSWSVPTQVWQGRDAMFPTVAANAAGDMVVAWTAARPGSFGLSGARAPSYAVRAKLRPVGGDWGPTTRLDDRRRQLRVAASVGIDDAGRALVTWAQVETGPDSVWVRRYDGSTWTPATRIAPLGTSPVDVKVAPDGRAAAVFVAGNAARGTRARARLMRPDGTWGRSVVLDQRPGKVTNRDASLTLTDDGWAAVFTAGPRAIWVRERVGNRWQPSTRLHATRQPAADVQLLVRPDAQDVLLWTEPTDAGLRLRSATRAGDGWERTEELGDAAAYSLQVTGAPGHHVAAWIAGAGATVATADTSQPVP
jgi:hypothetical protein